MTNVGRNNNNTNNNSNNRHHHHHHHNSHRKHKSSRERDKQQQEIEGEVEALIGKDQELEPEEQQQHHHIELYEHHRSHNNNDTDSYRVARRQSNASILVPIPSASSSHGLSTKKSTLANAYSNSSNMSIFKKPLVGMMGGKTCLMNVRFFIAFCLVITVMMIGNSTLLRRDHEDRDGSKTGTGYLSGKGPVHPPPPQPQQQQQPKPPAPIVAIHPEDPVAEKIVTVMVTITNELTRTETVTVTNQVMLAPTETPSLSSSTSNKNYLHLNVDIPLRDRSVRIPHPLGIDDSKPPAPNSPPLNTRRHSRFRCSGDDTHVEGFTDRTCIFENTCFNLRARQFEYYRRPETPPKPILFDADRGERMTFAEDGVGFVILQQTYETFGPNEFNHIAPKIVAGIAPPANDPLHTVVLSSPHAIWSTWAWDDNLGHLLWEEIGHLWYMMVRLNMVSTDLVAMHGFMDLPDRPLGLKFRNAFLQAAIGEGARSVDLWRYLET
ncbi:hypothetical protein HDU76_005176, partial [Blyttiomyces sp. JEL0837]